MALLLTLCPALFPAAARAHSFAVTRVEMEVEGAELRLTFWLNPPDLLQLVLADSLERRNFADLAHLRKEARPIGDYVEAHTALRVDGHLLKALDRGGWPPEVLPPTPPDAERDPDGRPIPPKVPLTLRYRLPEGAARLDLTLTHYAGNEFASLFDVVSHRVGAPYTRTNYIPAGRTLVFDLADAGLGEPVGSRSGATPHPATTTPADSETPQRDAFEPLARTIRQFLLLGFTHIVPGGLDHILFVLGLLLLAPRLRPLLKQVTAFTLAHSLTLALAMLNIVRLPSRVVEPLIALSIAVVALENVFRREVSPARWMIVFGFGLIHGLGFAGALAGLGVPPGQFFPALVGFNVGVELGQLAVLAMAGLLLLPVLKREWYHRRVAVPASLAIAAVGLFWAVQRVMGRG